MNRGIELLSARECQVLKRYFGGMAAKQVAHELGISIRTTETHLANARNKLGFKGHLGTREMLLWWHEQQNPRPIASADIGELPYFGA